MKNLLGYIIFIAFSHVGLAQSGASKINNLNKPVVSKPNKPVAVYIIKSHNSEYLFDSASIKQGIDKILDPNWISDISIIKLGERKDFPKGAVVITINDKRYPNVLRKMMPYLIKK